MLSMLAFFIWGTGVIKDFAFAMVVGIVAGTYSSIYVAAPLTEWIDTKMSKRRAAAGDAHARPEASASRAAQGASSSTRAHPVLLPAPQLRVGRRGTAVDPAQGGCR